MPYVRSTTRSKFNIQRSEIIINVVQANKAYYPFLGGIETIVRYLCEGLHEKGVSVNVLACNGSKSLKTTYVTVDGVNIALAPTIFRYGSMPISLSYSELLGKMKGDILHIHHPFPLADLSMFFKPKIKNNFGKIVLSWHSEIVRQRISKRLYLPFLKEFLRKVDKVIVATPNHISSSSLLSEFRDKCAVIPYGVKLYGGNNGVQTERDIRRIRDEYGTPLILFVGRLAYYKGIEYLIEAIRLMKEGHLLIIGSGPLAKKLEKQIHRNNLSDRIRIIPPVKETELFSYYRACDLFVLPSTERSEAFGIVQVEAMSCGKPVVSTDLDTGVTYVNQHAKTGLTVPVRDAKALSQACNLLLRDSCLSAELGNYARQRVHQEFNYQAMIDRVLNLYQSLLER